MSLPSQSAPRPDPQPKEAWRFEGSMKHAPCFCKPGRTADCRQVLRCISLAAITTARHACAGERTMLSRRSRRSRRKGAPWSGAAGLSAGSHHRPGHPP